MGRHTSTGPKENAKNWGPNAPACQSDKGICRQRASGSNQSTRRPSWRRRRTSLSRPEITEEEREAFQITEGERVRAAVDGSVGESPRKKPHKGDKA